MKSKNFFLNGIDYLKYTGILLCFTLFNSIQSQTSFYDTEVAPTIEIQFSEPNWDYQLDTAKIGEDEYLMAEWVKINGSVFDSVGVKYKGNSSYDSAYVKNPIHIALDEFKSQSYQGYTDIKLSNGHSDPSMIREVLAYKILSNYMDCPQSNFAKVYVNNQYIGLYTNVESITIDYCSDLFYTSSGTLIKSSPENPGPYTRSNLKYISSDSSDYFNLYEIKSDYGWNELVEICDLVTNSPGMIDSVFDIDNLCWMFAFNDVLVNLDSYSGAFAQNYYLYKDKSNQYNALVWDLNMSFGGFPFAGMQGGGMGSLSVTDMQNLSVSLHFTDSDWPLIKNVMSNSRFRKIYHAHLRTITTEMFSNQAYLEIAQQLQSTIDTSVQSDGNKFFTYEQFLGGLISNVQFGSYVVPGISVLMDARADFLENTAEFSYTLPEIASVSASNINPELNSEVFVTSQITDANVDGVFLFYRLGRSEYFSEVSMFDDGNHQDGLAGDGVFGTSFIMQTELVDYYIYAENSEACIFSPERAEHEFYSLTADIASALPGEIVINEFLAINQNDTVDETGQHEDWIELYNTTYLPVDLFGLYLSDDFTNPMKFAFPQNSMIPAHGFYIIWADEDSTTTSWLHCNFKLSGNGEEIMLSDIDGTIFDSLSFGPQGIDVSVGRCPNGSGEMEILSSTTFNSANCESGKEDYLIKQNTLAAYPNPANTSFILFNTESGDTKQIQIFNTIGELYYSGSVTDKTVIDVANWPSGLYVIVSSDTEVLMIIVEH